MRTLTISAAQKYVKQLQEELQQLRQKEARSLSFEYIDGQRTTKDIPEYSFAETQARVTEIIDTVARIKHAINSINVENNIDVHLVRMAAINERLSEIQGLAGAQRIKSRLQNAGQQLVKVVTELTYDPLVAEAVFTSLSEEVRQIQLTIDTLNNTLSIEIDI
jgi:hypothetical protein